MTADTMQSSKRTWDDLEVPDEYRLSFTLCSVEVHHWDGILLKVALRWQRDEHKRRPYLTIDIGRLVIQSGWLWHENPKEPQA